MNTPNQPLCGMRYWNIYWYDWLMWYEDIGERAFLFTTGND